MRLAARIMIGMVLFAAILFAAAGRLDLPFVWGYFAVMVASMSAVRAVIDRDLLRERIKPGAGGVDRYLRLAIAPFSLAHLIVGGLDVGRLHFSDTVPTWLQIAGLAGMAAGMVLPVWAIAVNRFFSPVVRIQEERGHEVVTAGPYRFIRHPGYAGVLIVLPCSALALGSWWSMAPLAVPLLLILRRVTVEDRFLQENLNGYAEYAERVRWRLAPGVW